MEEQVPSKDSVVNPSPRVLPVVTWKRALVLATAVVVLLTGSLVAGIEIGKKQAMDSARALVPAPTAGLNPTPTPLTGSSLAPFPLAPAPDIDVDYNYPAYLQELVDREYDFYIRASTKQGIKDMYEKLRNAGGCGGVCASLIDPATLDKQFELLAEVSQQPNCSLKATYIENIKSNFILFSGGPNTRQDVQGVKLKDGTCALRVFELDGYDEYLGNYFYKAGFIKGDIVVEMRAHIFPQKGFTKVENLWKSFGAQADGECDSACYEKMVDYMQAFSPNDSLVQEVVKAYDQILVTVSLPE